MSVSCIHCVYALGFVTTNQWIVPFTCNLPVFISECLFEFHNLIHLLVTVLLIVVVFCNLSFSVIPKLNRKMGNETSSIPSDVTTPTSDIPESVVSFGSKRRASVSSTRLPTPVEPPEPDLSNLTEEEISQIRSVIDRAKVMQKEEEKRIRYVLFFYTCNI